MAFLKVCFRPKADIWYDAVKRVISAHKCPPGDANRPSKLCDVNLPGAVQGPKQFTKVVAAASLRKGQCYDGAKS